ncbi:MAG: transglycosylase SLT domain-containing protein [Candidatus Anaerobiospirillum pullicola]|uniref:Transglycosylase SLT domain-containing protein n=1 Tax=Candidatus Anaerobiospirillum pullicola TaxID=2838451 RepID=A0A948WYP8_9GAMM|nr:transglycosylase SLT domain-containing protein [Candidatus Anaerobiospirillum pullicola]
MGKLTWQPWLQQVLAQTPKAMVGALLLALAPLVLASSASSSSSSSSAQDDAASTQEEQVDAIESKLATTSANITIRAGANSNDLVSGSAEANGNSDVYSGTALHFEDQMMLNARRVDLDLFAKMPKSRITKMREAYVQAENAFRRGDEALGFAIQKQHLQGYPLNIWLNYYYLANDIKTSKFDAVMKFINSNEQAELAELLRDRYARYLSDVRDYARLSVLVGPKPFDETKLSTLSFKQKTQLCRFYEANWPLDKVNEEAISFATRIYLDLSKRPLSCNGLMALFDAKGYLTDKLVLKRFENAYVQRSYTETTDSLAQELQHTDFAKRVDQQMQLYSQPEKLFDEVKGNSEDEHRVAVLAFKRYANLSPRSARNDFKKFIKTYDPSETELIDIYQIFASSFLGRSYGLSDVEWVDRNLPTLAWNDTLKEQRLRRAIYFAQWKEVYVLIDHLSPDLKDDINWRYWKGRAALELGKTDEGNALLAEVAKDRSFFGFYAAQTLGVDYPFNYLKIDPNFSFPLDIANNKAAIRFLELYALDDDNAIYEWREIAKRSPEHEAMVMAQWALQTGNISYAIDFVVSSGRWDALDYRFPIAYRSSYEHFSKESNVPLSFLYGVSRQESMLNHNIRSWAGAVGLMQVMPGTARDIARKEKWKFSGTNSLTDPETNIQYGSTYLRWMLDKFDNNRILAAAAYNAGPGRIPRWRSNDGVKRDVAMFVECIPFKETRKYVQNVILYDAIYNFLITGEKGELIHPNELSYAY